MKRLLFPAVIIYCLCLMISCECTKVDCYAGPYIFVDIVDSLTNSSLVFGDDARLDIPDIDVFSNVNGEVVNFPILGYKNPSISSDSILFVNISSLSVNTIFIRTSINSIDTIELFTRVIPSSSCCDMSTGLDSIDVNDTILFENDVLLFYR